jgi:hypothetical protein
MKLAEATAFANLRIMAPETPVREKVKTATEVAQEIFTEARERGIVGNMLGGCSTPEKWQKRWLPSKQFRLMRLPLNAAALPCQPRGPDLVLKKIHAREESPIVVDYNRNQVGRTINGFTPAVVVLDGKHRFAAATARGDSHIMAWVGEVAIREMHGMGSGGGGPAPERTTSSPGARLVAEGKRMKEMNVDRIKKDFEAACAGGYKPSMKAATTPGCEDAVQGLKRAKNVSNPWAVANWMHDEGRC